MKLFVYFCDACRFKKIIEFDKKHLYLFCPICKVHEGFTQAYTINKKE